MREKVMWSMIRMVETIQVVLVDNQEFFCKNVWSLMRRKRNSKKMMKRMTRVPTIDH